MTSCSEPFYWVERGRLAGMPFPFLHPNRRLAGGAPLAAYDDDLPVLHAAGIRGVVSLVNLPSDESVYHSAGFRYLCLPVADGSPPSIAQVGQFVSFADDLLARGEAVVVHCHAGLGRTGTMLAGYLVWKGSPASEAIRRIRLAEPAAIETSRQVQFLTALAAART